VWGLGLIVRSKVVIYGVSRWLCSALGQICCRKVWIDVTAPWMCVCVVAGNWTSNLVKGKIKVEMLRNNEIQNKNSGLL